MGLISKINELKMDIQKKSIEIRNLRLWITKKTKNPSFMRDYLDRHKVNNVIMVGYTSYTDLVIEELRSADIRITAMVAGEWSINSYGIPVYNSVEECKKCIRDQEGIAIFVTDESEIDTDMEYISLFDILHDK